MQFGKIKNVSLRKRTPQRKLHSQDLASKEKTIQRMGCKGGEVFARKVLEKKDLSWREKSL